MAEDGSVPFERFVNNLSDFKFMALDAAIERVLSVRGLDLVRTEWLKALGKGLHELRVRHPTPTRSSTCLAGIRLRPPRPPKRSCFGSSSTSTATR